MMNSIKNIFKGPLYVEAALIASILLIGGFSEFFSCIIAVVTAVLLIVRLAGSSVLRLRLNIPTVSVGVIALFYLISVFYAVDPGMAFIGFIKFLPAALFALLVMQDGAEAEKALAALPDIAVVTGVISLLLALIPSGGFLVDGRLAGIFQYPNTFAMFLLTAQLLGLSRDKLSAADIVKCVFLAGLIVATQSRAVFVLLLIFDAVVLFFKKGKVIKLVVAGVIVLAGLLTAVLYPVLAENEFTGRFLSLSVFESTFAGRLLYWSDSLALLLRHPFGMGYLGYWFTEQSVQTGVYSVRYIHNDILQTALDVGWLPAAALVLCFFRVFFSKRRSLGYKLALAAFLLHIIFDFDLEFTSMWFILILLLDVNSGRELEIKRGKAGCIFMSVISALLCLYFAFPLGFGYFHAPETAAELYPYYTEADIDRLINEQDIAKQDKIASGILNRNRYAHIAYSLKAQKAYSEGDIKSLMQYKHKIFEIAPFSYDEYEEYAYMLISCIPLYQQSGDTASAEKCAEELIAVRDRLSALSDRVSYLGSIIRDHPQTELPEDISDYIDAIRE